MTNRKKVYFYPSAPRGKAYGNPYCTHYKEAINAHHEVVNMPPYEKTKIMYSLNLLRYSFTADVFILNWIENVAQLTAGRMQYSIARLALKIVKWRKREIVWMLHNMQPHEGENRQADNMTDYLMKNSDLIVTHSRKAAKYANEKAVCRVEYICHPFSIFPANTQQPDYQQDVLIWGTILPYKGVAEFLSSDTVQQTGLRIRVIGKCDNAALADTISQFTNDSIIFENRKVDFDELQTLVAGSRYVLFPYIGDSISSSGALIDTIAMGGNAVGPNVGAFKDLAQEGVCIVYNSEEELTDILMGTPLLDCDQINEFISNNTWERFGNIVSEWINNI